MGGLAGSIYLFLAPVSAHADETADRRFVTQTVPSLDAASAAQALNSPAGLVNVQSPTGWRLFQHPNQSETGTSNAANPHVGLDSMMAIFYHPETDLYCDLDISVLLPQKARISGFGSEYGVRLSPAVQYKLVQRNLETWVELPMREFGRVIQFERRPTEPALGPHLTRATWRWESEDGIVSEGIGESNLINSAIITNFCHWPKGQASSADGAARIADLRGAIKLTPPSDD